MLCVDVGPSEDGAFWLAFLRGLLARGLSGVKLVTSDSHQGLKTAIASVLQGASWQRCRTHTIRTQSPEWLTRCGAVRRRTMARWDHMVDLQRLFLDDDALDQQVEQHLLLLKGGLGQERPDAPAKGGQAREHLLSMEPLAA